MSLWAEYRRERKESIFIEVENGFISYHITGDECYIQDIYVRKEFRSSGLAQELAAQVCEIAKAKGCRIITGTIQVGAVGDTMSARLFIQYGMKLLSAQNNVIILYKDL